MLGAGASVATVMAAYAYSSGLRGYKQDEEEDEVERKEALKKLRRRPIQETIDQLGEGRGVFILNWIQISSANKSRYIRSRI